MRPGAYYRSLVAAHLGIRPGEGWTLDLGAGEGTMFGGTRTVALDPKPRRGFVGGDGTALPFRCGVFQTVLAMDVLEHVPDDGLLRSELSRVAEPGSTVWISVPSAEMRLLPGFLTGLAHRAWGHVRPGYTVAELSALGAETIQPWNEPAYRALYPVIRAAASFAPGIARWLVRLAFAFDKRDAEGDRGHYFCRIRMSP